MLKLATLVVAWLSIFWLKIVTTGGIKISRDIFSAIGAKRICSNSVYNVTIFVEPSAQSQLTFKFNLKSYEEFIMVPGHNNFYEYSEYNDYSEPDMVLVIPKIITSSESVSVRPGESRSVGIQIPNLTESRYNLTMSATDEYGMVFEDFNVVIVSKNTKKQSLLIQSDKVVYKPSETVKYRILLLDPKLRPLSNQTVNVTITDAQQNVIKILNDQKILGGIFSSDLKLSQEPVQGDWKLEAKVNHEVTTHVFTVEEYVLPKFKVDIIPPPYLTFDKLNFVVEVQAAYTFGKKMAGECQIEVTEVFNQWEARMPKRITKTSALDGSAFFEINVEKEFEGGYKLQSEKSYEMHANVTESLTGRNVSASGVTVKVYRWPHKIEQFQTSAKFKPGLPFAFKFKITTPNGVPVEDSNSTAVEFRHGFSVSAEDGVMFSSLSANGIASFTFPKMPTNERLALAPVQVTYKGQTIQFNSPSRHLSPTQSYMDLVLSSATVAANSELPVEVRCTKVISSLSVVLYGRGQILNVKRLTFAATKFHSFSITVPSSAGPTGRILVYTIIDQSQEVVAESREIAVTNYFGNYLTVNLSKSQAGPGEKVSLFLATTAGSLVLLRGVDQSVLVMKQDKDITTTVIDSELKGFLPGEDTNRLHGGSSTFQTFDETGIVIFTNSNLEREKPRQRPFERWVIVRPSRRFGFRRRTSVKSARRGRTRPSVFAESDDGDEIIVTKSSKHTVVEDYEEIPIDYQEEEVGNRSPKVLKVRKDFPETWIWQEIQTNYSETVLEQVVPDTLTSWIISGYALSPEAGIGVLPRSLTLKTFRPFFLSLNKPYSIVKGEIFGLQILVHNYLEGKVKAAVTLKNPDAAFKFYNEEKKTAKSLTQNIDIKPGEVKSLTIVIQPKKFGVMKLVATVTCDVAGDAVSETLIVKPPGQKQERNKAVLLDLRKQTKVMETLNAEFPPKRVKGADSVKISVIADLLGSSIKNLDKLLKMPYGCGEQNMLTFVPDIVILEYLKAVGELTDEIKTKATQFLESGYQRELTYRHDDGSFSAFGKSDGTGSTWLTAFVVRSFVAAQPHITVDYTVVGTALRFLASKQHENGKFVEAGRLLNSGMKGGANDDFSLTAYILLAFLEATKSKLDYPMVNFTSVIDRGLKYVSTASPKSLGTYSLALVTYVLQAANSNLKPMFQSQLEKLAIQEGSLTYWEPPKQNSASQQPAWEPSTKPLAVEMTAYPLLTYLKDGALDKAMKIGKWLLGQRNAEGGFISTQDTVVGLDALGKFALATFSSDVDMEISAGQTSFKVKNDNVMVLQEAILSNSTKSVTFEATGKGTALVQLSWSYYVETASDKPAFAIEVKVAEGHGKGNLKLNLCARYAPADDNSGESNMAVMEVNLPSGYAFEREELSEVEVSPGVKRIDLEEGATRLNIYFDYLDSSKRCVDVPADRVFKVADLAPSYVSVYDYYDPTRHARAFYTPPGLSASQITCRSKDGASAENCD